MGEVYVLLALIIAIIVLATVMYMLRTKGDTGNARENVRTLGTPDHPTRH